MLSHAHAHTEFTHQQAHIWQQEYERYSHGQMTVFINGRQADSLTFSLVKVINVTIYRQQETEEEEEKGEQKLLSSHVQPGSLVSFAARTRL